MISNYNNKAMLHITENVPMNQEWIKSHWYNEAVISKAEERVSIKK